jgi:uncharacterized protein YjiS (DUF1127 family)
MRMAGASMPFVNGLLLNSDAAKERRGVNNLGERFDDAAGTRRPSIMIWLRAVFNGTAIWLLRVKSGWLQQRLRQTAYRELAENIRRLEELSPHLLDDIGVRKLDSATSNCCGSSTRLIPPRPHGP